MNTTVDLSIIILSWNSAKFLGGCLSSIENDLERSRLTYEVLVIDNGSRDSSLEILADFEAQGLPLTVIPLGRNTGTTFSRNIGMRMARGRYLCVMDSDIELRQERTLETLVRALENNPRAGIIAPTLNHASGNYQKSFDQFPTIGHKLRRILFLRNMERAEGHKPSATRDALEVDYVISAFWLFHHDLIDSIGLLDEKIFYAPEDVDFCLRSWLNGSPVLLHRGVAVIHDAQEISRGNPFTRAAFSHLKGLYYYFRKYRYCLGLGGIHARIQAAVETRKKAFIPNREPVFNGAAPARSASSREPVLAGASRHQSTFALDHDSADSRLHTLEAIPR